MQEYCYCHSPIGRLLLVGRNGVLEELYFANATEHMEIPTDWRQKDSSFKSHLLQLDQYFAGQRRTFAVPIAPQGTPFQQQVWQELCKIPFGGTSSYGDIALRIGRPKACRAVGMANRKNPIPIIIPCHRVIGKDGSLTGFGGGLAVKQQLLDLERRSPVAKPPFQKSPQNRVG